MPREALLRSKRFSRWLQIGGFHILAALLALLLVMGPVTAQDRTGQAEEAPLIVGLGNFPPYFYRDAQGSWTGFIVDLANMLSEEIGIAVDLVGFNNAAELTGALARGDIQTIPGLARLPVIEDSNVFSNPVATESLRLITLAERASELSGTTIEGLRIGIVSTAVGSDVEELLAANTPVEFDAPDTAFMALLVGELDAVLAPNPLIYTRAREAGVDDLIGFVDPPIRNVPRFVPLHESRANLLPAINDAIARMEADGRLRALRARYFIDLPEPPPEILRVPVAHSPPWVILDDNAVTGFAAEIVSELAELTGLEIEFVPVSSKEYFDAATTAGEDLIPVVLATDEIRSVLDLTLPFDRSRLDILVSDGASQLQTLADLKNARIGTLPDTALVARENDLEVAEIVPIDDLDGLVAALNAGEVDAIMETVSGLEDEGVTARFRSIGSPGFEVTNVIGLRPGIGAVRQQLNAVIPGYLLSDNYAALKEKYFGEPVFWTPRRVNTTIGILIAGFLLLLGILYWQRQRQRQLVFEQQEQDLIRQKAHSEELNALVSELEIANREQAEFTYAISHDLKSPTNTMLMLISELEASDAFSEDDQKVVSDMKLTNARMGQLIEDVLHYSRLVEEHVSKEPIDTNDLIDGIIRDLAADVAQADANIQREDMPELQGHPIQMRLLFQNLLSNAVKFRSPDRKPIVKIAAETTSDGLKVTVSDNGIGIPERYCERVFGMFSRLHALSEYEGSGLGLAICRRVMSNHGGEIHALPGADGGTTFELTFKKEDHD